MNMPLKSSTHNDQERLIRFKELSHQYVEIGRQCGIRIKAYMDPAMVHYHRATSEQQINATRLLEAIVSIHEETVAAGENPTTSRFLVWRALKKLNLVPPMDAFEHISGEDVVMIYDNNFVALFWNLQFFKYSSFTIEQLFFTAWPDFTRREQKYLDMCYSVSMEVYSGKIKGSIFPDIPEHLVEEIDSPEGLKTMMAIPFAASLQKDGNFGGMLVVQRMRIVD